MQISSMNVLDKLAKNSIRDPITQCWNYKGTNADGYGQVTINGKFLYVHRVSASIFFGFDIDSKYCIRHSCNSKACWSPEHILSGTDAQNNLDNKLRGVVRNESRPKSYCPSGHLYEDGNILITSKGKRMCRECNRIQCRQRYERSKFDKLRGITKISL